VPLGLVSRLLCGKGRVSALFREVTFCASYKCHCFGVKGSRLSWVMMGCQHSTGCATGVRTGLCS
jgi:hypothetical protein